MSFANGARVYKNKFKYALFLLVLRAARLLVLMNHFSIFP